MRRRAFLAASLVAGTGAMGIQAAAPAEAIDVALIGAGLQGRNLLNCLLAIGNVRVRAVCDIWPYRRASALGYLKTYQQQAAEFEDYRQMLRQLPGLSAVVVATPDFAHPEQTMACLAAGLHVYCEPPMAPTLAAAQAMAEAAKKSGKLLAIGYQRRSNPRYQHVAQHLLHEAELLGDITAAESQWNQSELDELGWPRRQVMAEAELNKYGYANMREFRNWRWFRRYSAGPFAGFACHQLDVLNWFLGSRPQVVLAAGGGGYYKNRQHPDHVTAIYQYPLGERCIHATCRVLTTSRGTEGNHELLVGTEGSLRISDNPKWTRVFREPSAVDWDEWKRKGYLTKSDPPAAPKQAVDKAMQGNEVHVQETGEVTQYEIPVVLDKSPFQPHVENFLEAIRGKAPLNCPAETALASEAAVLKALEALEAQKLLCC